MDRRTAFVGNVQKDGALERVGLVLSLASFVLVYLSFDAPSMGVTAYATCMCPTRRRRYIPRKGTGAERPATFGG